MLSAHLHPEFGLLCPSPVLRRAAKVVLTLCVVGLIANARSVGALIVDNEFSVAGEGASARPEVPADGSAAATPPGEVAASADGGVVAAGTPARKAAARSDLGAPPNSAAGLDVPGKNVSALPKSRSALMRIEDAEKISCEQNTWAHLDGHCGAGRMRKVRVAMSRSGEPEMGGNAALPQRKSAAAPHSSPATGAASQSGGATAPSFRSSSGQPVAVNRAQTAPSGRARRRDPTGSPPPLREARPHARNQHSIGAGRDFRHGPFPGLFGLFR